MVRICLAQDAGINLEEVTRQAGELYALSFSEYHIFDPEWGALVAREAEHQRAMLDCDDHYLAVALEGDRVVGYSSGERVSFDLIGVVGECAQVMNAEGPKQERRARASLALALRRHLIPVHEQGHSPYHPLGSMQLMGDCVTKCSDTSWDIPFATSIDVMKGSTTDTQAIDDEVLQQSYVH